MIRRKLGIILHFHPITLLLRVRRLLIRAVAGCYSTKKLWVGDGRAVESEGDVFPVVAVSSGRDAVEGLVFRKAPGVHDGVAAVVPGQADVGLAFALVAAPPVALPVSWRPPLGMNVGALFGERKQGTGD